MAYHQDIRERQGKKLVDRDGERIGKLEDVYVDIETKGLIGRCLTLVPLAEITIGPDNLQVAVSKDQVKNAPNRFRPAASRRIPSVSATRTS